MGGFNYGGGKGMGLAGVLNVARHQSQAGVQRETVAATHHRVVLGLAADGLKRGPLVQH